MKRWGRGFWQCHKLLQDRTASGKKILMVGGREGLYSSLTLLPPTAGVGKDTMPHREVGQAEKTWGSQGTCPLDEHSPRGQGSVNCPSLPFLSRGPGTEDGDLVQCLVRATRGSFEPTGS